MSRRQHVVRTDEQGGVGSGRSLSGAQILCATESPRPTLLSGSVSQGDEMLIAPITIESTHDFQRCVVTATIRHVSALVPDDPTLSPEYGTWIIRFECQQQVPEHFGAWLAYATMQVNETTVLRARWQNEYDGSPDFSIGGLWDEDHLIMEFDDDSGDVVVDDPAISGVLEFQVYSTKGPMWLEVTVESPFGKYAVDRTITTGEYIA
jgi:hypothetical protein